MVSGTMGELQPVAQEPSGYTYFPSVDLQTSVQSPAEVTKRLERVIGGGAEEVSSQYILQDPSGYEVSLALQDAAAINALWMHMTDIIR